MEAAFRYIYGVQVSCLPLRVGRKTPAIESWRDYQFRLPVGIEVARDWPANSNVGIITGAISRLVVVDCESFDDAKWFWRNCGETTCVVETPRGIHFYFKHPGEHIGNAQRVKDKDGKPRYDIRGDGGYVVAPPSHVEACEDVKVTGDYKWRGNRALVSIEDLPEFKPEWRPIQQTQGYTSKQIKDGLAYIAKIKAVSGQGGHSDTYRAACCLRASGMVEVDALAALIEWNVTNAEPPWSVAELLHKVRDAYRSES